MKRAWLGCMTALVMISLFCSCDKSREKQLSKKWQVHDVEFIRNDSLSVGHDALLAGGEDMQMQMMEEMLGRPTYELKDDGSCVVSNKGTTNKGKWKLQEGGKELLIETEGLPDKQREEIHPMTIEQLDDTSLSLLLHSPQSSYKVRYRLSVVKD